MKSAYRPRIGFVSVCWSAFDVNLASSIHARSLKCLRELEAAVVGPKEPVQEEKQLADAIRQFKSADVDAIILQNGTFAWGGYAVALAEEFDLPFVLWAPLDPLDKGALLQNSLCGVNMNASALHRLNKRYVYVYGNPQQQETLKKLKQIVAAVGAMAKLRKTRVALVGYRVPGFYGSTFDELDLRHKLGVEVKHIGLSEIRSTADSISSGDLQEVRQELTRTFPVGVLSPDKATLFCRTYEAFRRALQENGCTAAAVKCWPQVASVLGIGVCGVLSALTDSGMMTGCEADMMGTVTMLIQRYIAGTSPFIVDLVYADRKGNTAVLWHCGNAPVSLAGSEVELGEDGELNFSCKSGVVTFAKLTETGGYRMLLSSGKATGDTIPFRGTGVNVEFDCGVEKLLDTIIYGGFEHHFSIVYVDITEEMRLFSRLVGIELVEV